MALPMRPMNIACLQHHLFGAAELLTAKDFLRRIAEICGTPLAEPLRNADCELRLVRRIWDSRWSFFAFERNAEDPGSFHRMVAASPHAVVAWHTRRPGIAPSRTRSRAILETTFRLLSGMRTLMRFPTRFNIVIRSGARPLPRPLAEGGDDSGCWLTSGLPHLREYRDMVAHLLFTVPESFESGPLVESLGCQYVRVSPHSEEF